MTDIWVLAGIITQFYSVERSLIDTKLADGYGESGNAKQLYLFACLPPLLPLSPLPYPIPRLGAF